jgi:hypothetical protein
MPGIRPRGSCDGGFESVENVAVSVWGSAWIVVSRVIARYTGLRALKRVQVIVVSRTTIVYGGLPVVEGSRIAHSRARVSRDPCAPFVPTASF